MVGKSLVVGVLAFVVLGCGQAPRDTGAAPERAVVAAAETDEGDGQYGDGQYEFAQQHQQHVPRRIQRFDTNHDGVLQASEVPARLHDWFVAVDTNKDNIVTADEIRAYNRAHPHPHRPGPRTQSPPARQVTL